MDFVRDFVRGAVTVHVLHHAEENAVHGAWLTEELARHGHVISPGTLYPLLHRLEHAGLLVSHGEVVDGRARRCYTITDAGRAALRSLRKAVTELAEEVLGAGHENPPSTAPRHKRSKGTRSAARG